MPHHFANVRVGNAGGPHCFRSEFGTAEPRQEHQRSRSSSYKKTFPIELDDRHEAVFAERQALAEAQPPGGAARKPESAPPDRGGQRFEWAG